MLKILAVLLILIVGGTTLYALYQGVVLPIIQPLLKTKQKP